MRNYYYEHQRSFRGENFFEPVEWSEGAPTYFNTFVSPDVMNTYTFSITPLISSMAQSENGVEWNAQGEGYTERGTINDTVGDGGFAKHKTVSSYALSINSTSVETASFSSSNNHARNTFVVSFSIAVGGTRIETTSEFTGHTHTHTNTIDWDEDTYVSLGSSNKLTFDFSSSLIDFIALEPYIHTGKSVSYNTTNSSIIINAFRFNVSVQDVYFEVQYLVPKKTEKQTAINWREFSEIGFVNVDSTVIWPIARFNAPGEKVVFGNTFEQSVASGFPWLSKEELIVLTTINLTSVTTTASNVTNIASSSWLISGSSRTLLSFSSFMTSVASITFLGTGLKFTTVELHIPLASFTTFASFTDILPPGLSFSIVTDLGTRTETATQAGYAFYTYPESIYQQRILLHSHFGASFMNYTPISGYAPFIQSFSSTSPIYTTLSTKLIKTLSGDSFKGYFPYSAFVVPNVYQFVWTPYQSHEQYVVVTEHTSVITSTTQTARTTLNTTSFNSAHLITVEVSFQSTIPSFTTKTTFQTTYLDTIYYKTSNLTMHGGLFTLRRSDKVNNLRSQVISVKLLGPIFGSGKVTLNLGGNIGPFGGKNVIVVGGYDYYMDLMGFTNQPTIVLNWGNWFRELRSFESSSHEVQKLAESSYRLLRGEFSGFQSTLTIPLYHEAIFSHHEIYRLEIINESFIDYALEAYLATETQTRNLRFLTSSPLFPARGQTWNTVVPTRAIREI